MPGNIANGRLMTYRSVNVAAMDMKKQMGRKCFLYRLNNMLKTFFVQNNAHRNQIAPIIGMFARYSEVCCNEPLAYSEAIIHDDTKSSLCVRDLKAKQKMTAEHVR